MRRIDLLTSSMRAMWALILAIILSASFITPALAISYLPPNAAETLVATVIVSQLAFQDIPGASVAIINHGDVTLNRGFGLRDQESALPVESNTYFEIGSITKQFTAAAILQLREAGKLKLSDHLGKFIPEYIRGRNVTIEQMLYQTSGIPDHINDLPNNQERLFSTVGSDREAIALIQDLPFHFKPGTQWEYSNTNYLLLSTVVARVSHSSFHDYVRRNIFAKANMQHSCFLKDEVSLRNVATGYYRAHSGKLVRAGHIGDGWSGGAGSIVSTAGDMARWDIAFFGGRIITLADVKLATEPTHLPDGKSTQYGFGWAIDDVDGLPIVSHDGAMPGFTSINDVFPTLGVTIVVLTNNGDGLPDAIAKNILAATDSKFARQRDIPQSGENEAVTARIKQVWLQLVNASPNRSELTPSFNQELTSSGLAFYKRYFTRRDLPSPPLRCIYKGKQRDPDGTTYSYRVLFNGGFAIRVSGTVSPNRKIAAMDVEYD